MGQIDIKKAKCTELALCAGVELAKSGEDITGFELAGYTGAAVERVWGKFAIQLSGISSKQKMPIFMGHNSSEIVGFSTETLVDGVFRVRGKFSKSTEAAKQVKALASEGFPWQASIGVKPKSISHVKTGESVQINGFELSGPAEIWLESEVFETSFVPLGADSNTSAEFFSIKDAEESAKQQPERVSMDFAKLSIADLKENRPDLLEEILKGANPSEEALATARKEGAEAERLRIKSVHEQMFPGHEELVSAAMFDGESQAGDVAIQINKANLDAQKVGGEELSNDAPGPVSEPAHSGLPEKEGPVTEEKLKKQWEKSPDLQAEFGGDFESFLALEMPGDGVTFKTLSKSEAK